MFFILDRMHYVGISELIIIFDVIIFSVEQKINDPDEKMFLFKYLDWYDKIEKTIPVMKKALHVKIFDRKF